MINEKRPWGEYDILLDSDTCKVKRITVNPKQRLSYQYHYKRSETWIIVSGAGVVTLDDIDQSVAPGDVITINPEQRHRVCSSKDETLVFIEVQRGSYFGEDDIVRLSDDYGRLGGDN